jgi:putative FmdB family regulatory protein
VAQVGIGTLSARLPTRPTSPNRSETGPLPTYEYRCESCDQNFDLVQSFHDDPLTACPTCGSPVRKVFGNVGIVFKGSGFYKTDSRPGDSAKPTTGEPSSTPASGSETSGSDGQSQPAPSEKGDGKATEKSAAPPKETPKKSPTPATTSSNGASSGSGK